MEIAYLLQKSHAKAVIISELLVKVCKLWTIQLSTTYKPQKLHNPQ
jgi:hypothetical protein